ncbi:MAG: hypothetical protein HYR88_13675 [Verrucomicrobia bacterium]|nr:hypothetical protein [Verrucomicrobiota bacterium]MBI3869613.1 hypothetical protein [Verrucomicrobiota bacterium]
MSRVIRRATLAVLASLPVWILLPAAQAAETSATNSPSSAFDPSGRSAPGRDLNLDGGFFSGRMKFGVRPDLPSPGPGTAENGISRRDFLRIKDMKEEKENWMYLERGQLQREREKKEDEGGLRSRWDVQDDLRKKSWLDYGSQKAPGDAPGGGGAQPESRSQAQYEAELRDRQLFDRKDGSRRYDGSLSPSASKSGAGRETGGAHQVGELNLRDLVGGGPSRFEENSDFSFKDLFGGEYVNLKERETAETKRLDFQNFLNQTRTPTRSSAESSGGLRDLPQGLQHSFGSFGRVAGRDGWGEGRSPGAGNSPLGGAFDPSFGSTVPGNAQGAPLPYRSFDPAKSYITPSMMQPPKRRF